MEILSIFISLLIISFLMFIFGLVLSAFLSFDIGLILILVAGGILVFNMVYYYLNKNDSSQLYEKVEYGTKCPNCGSPFDKTGKFCPKCGYKVEL